MAMYSIYVIRPTHMHAYTTLEKAPPRATQPLVGGLAVGLSFFRSLPQVQVLPWSRSNIALHRTLPCY